MSLETKPRLKTARAVHANRGVEARYKARMLALIDSMSDSVEYWLRARYKAAPPVLAMDETPSRTMQRELRKLARQWQKKFNDSAPLLADAYAKSTFGATDAAFKAALRDAGWTVQFRQTAAMRDIYNATVQENIGLIKSIPQEYLQQVQGSAMRSYTSGRDLSQMVKDIRKLYPHAANRAVLIARDQNNKATASAVRARRLELGISKATWQHSGGGKTPRPLHVAADGKEFDVDKGCLIDGKYVQPGEEINCRCTSRSVLPI